MSYRCRGKKRKQAPRPTHAEEERTSSTIFWLDKVPSDMVPNIVTYLGSGRMRNSIGDEEDNDPEQEQQEDEEAGMNEEGEEEEEDDRSGDGHGSSDDDDDEASSEEDPEERARRLAPDVASLVCLYQAGGKSYRRAIRNMGLKCCGSEFDSCDNLLFTAQKRRRLPFGCRDCKFAMCLDCTRFNKCEDCDTPNCCHCKEPMWDCCICGKRRCDDCPHPGPHTAYRCCQCQDSFCDECRPFTCCDDCGEATCADCPAEICDECNSSSCLKCNNFMENCVGCDRLLCGDCFSSWSTYCHNDHHKYCSECENHTGGCKICRSRGRFAIWED